MISVVVTLLDGFLYSTVMYIIFGCFQTFDVKLLSVSSGLSQLGTMTTVRVAILKNDSPNGLFRFALSEVIF